MIKILVVEDDPMVGKLHEVYINQLDGFKLLHVARSSDEALEYLEEKQVDLVILDVMMPGTDGLQTCQRLRHALPALPILMLTAKGDPLDRIIGLELGADDYLAKPFEPRELLARIKALLRRANVQAHGNDEQAQQALRFGSLTIDPNTRTVRLNDAICELTAYQFDLLHTLAQRAGRVLTRDQIMEAVRGRELEAFDRSIDVHIGRIRQAIETDVKNPQRILTVRGVGYVLAKEQA